MQLDEGEEIGRLTSLRPKQIGILVDGIGVDSLQKRHPY